MERSKFYVHIIGIVFDPAKKKILIGKNKGDKNFSFIDGELRENEEINEGIKRVTKGKTGYSVSNLGAVFTGKKVGKDDTLSIYFLCEVIDGKEVLGKKVDQIIWVKANGVEKLINEKLPSRLKEYLKNITG